MKIEIKKFFAWTGWLATIVAIGAAVVVGVHWFAVGKLVALLPPCPLHHYCGWYCAGCGSTRMLLDLASGDIYGAFRKNPLAFLLLPPLLYWAASVSAKWFGLRLPGCRLWAGMIYLLGGLIVGYAIARNIPWEPFLWLRPQ